jgi:hypothetical protein
LIKIEFLTISNILMQSRDKFAKIKVNNYYLVNISKISITIDVMRLIKDIARYAQDKN